MPNAWAMEFRRDFVRVARNRQLGVSLDMNAAVIPPAFIRVGLDHQVSVVAEIPSSPARRRTSRTL